MKALAILCTVVAATPLSAFADCVAPTPPGDPPSGATATREEMLAAQTAISSVDGEKGKLVIRGFSVEDLAPHVTFEDMVFLLWHDVLPDAEALNRFSGELAAHSDLVVEMILVEDRDQPPDVPAVADHLEG